MDATRLIHTRTSLVLFILFSSGTMDEVTLIVLQHGFMGNTGHMAHIERELTNVTSDQSVSILNVQANEGKYSYDGIDICGERLALAIQDHIQEIELEGSKKVKRFVMIGYSLGGLMARYAIGILGEAGFFDTVEPLYYITFATPHMGIRREATSKSNRFYNYLFGHMLSRSGEQLLFRDEQKILNVISDPNKPFYQYLSKFKVRRAYGNLINDRTVPYWTAAMETVDYTDDPENSELMFDQDYESIVSSVDDQKSAKKRTRSSVGLVRIIFMATLSPLALPIAIAYVGTTSALSQARSKRLLETKYTKSHSDSFTTTTASSSSTSSDNNTSSTTRLSGASWRPMDLLLPEQIEIQSNLEALDWERVMVYIDGVNAHGSIVCRQGWLTNDGGRAVVQHLVDTLVI
ncbi:putative serine esterase-domain-containing protein [Fennellomyces sp. T-0311]|nr:putative serine esterase-domain-containing protein [Fennellomyces sp. T-0311]